MAQDNKTSPSRPSSLACVPCRHRHLKCDALVPLCTRCQTTNTECRYIRSRRGLRPKQPRIPSPQHLDDGSLLTADIIPEWLNVASLEPDLDINAASTIFQPFDAVEVLDIPPLVGSDDALAAIPISDLDFTTASATFTPEMAYDPMVQLYYQNFHQSHPILLPRRALCSPLSQLFPPYIFSIVRYIGAHYYPDPSFKQAYRQQAYAALSDPTLRDGFKVQELLLLAIIDHSHFHEDSAHQLIQTAVSVALEIGMDRSCFARQQSHGHAVFEESWRRTYWELYVVDGLLAAMGEQRLFQLYRQRADVRLPCAERMYNSGDNVVLTQQTFDDLQNSWVIGQFEQPFSSFAYRINAVHKLGMVLELNRSLDVNLEPQIETVDAHLASSLMALPSLQGEEYDSSSHDEMIFQAQMTLYLAIIYLHHPQSNMCFASFNTNTSCTRLKTRGQSELLSPGNFVQRPDFDLHSQKLLRAADLLSGLATLPSSIRYRSPFFTCALAICVVVHTAAGLAVSGSGKEESLKARIQLSIGALNALGKIWPLAKSVQKQMVEMYREVVRR